MTPEYIELYHSGKLECIIENVGNVYRDCCACPHECRVDRWNNEKGKCGSGIYPIVSSYSPHFGEESCLVGKNGSGTIFFTHCNLSCIFCQNYDISHLGRGEEISYEELARIMLSLQERGCHNINFVSPTHMVYPILMALQTAIPEGLKVPLVYNSGGYDSREILSMMEGVFDIFMPDFKYMDSDVSCELSGAGDYPLRAMEALGEMHRQRGDLVINSRGLAEQGLLVRHLVLPNNYASTDRVLSFLADLSLDTYVNIMAQYHPQYRARECFDLRRRIVLDEYDEAVGHAEKLGLHRLDGRHRRYF